MGFWRNPEVKRGFLWLLLLCALLCGGGFWLDRLTGLYTLMVCLVLVLFFMVMTARRYRQIARLSLLIDRILHGGEQLDISENQEGELSILQSEITKMTVRLREQTDQLKREKVYLNDSIADISHQLRTPLTSMNLIAAQLFKSGLSDEKRMELARDLNGLLGQMDWLISTLLRISKLDAKTAIFKKEPVNVKTLVTRAAEPLLIPMELREITLQMEGEEGTTFWGDFSWSVEAVSNILKNCVEHVGPGGEIRVRFWETALVTTIVISDNGCGIDGEDLPHIFERFYRGKNATDTSFGIGLALSRMIVVEQDGALKAANNKEGGSCFTLRFFKGVI